MVATPERIILSTSSQGLSIFLFNVTVDTAISQPVTTHVYLCFPSHRPILDHADLVCVNANVYLNVARLQSYANIVRSRGAQSSNRN